MVTLSDIDLQKRSESALIQSEKLAAVGRLAASISHEINNPLEAVTNLLYLIHQQDSLSKESQELLDNADQELARVSQIASHTLQFHRQATKARAISAQEILKPTLGLYAGRLVNSKIDLVVQHRSEKLLVYHEGEIRQVLNNLIGNAIGSMKLGGRLILRTKNARFWKSGFEAVRIAIADTGTGVEPHLLADIFNAFFTTKGIHGTGLGLWIAKGIVDRHGGRLQVFSKTAPGCSGTVFSLLLPTDPYTRI